MDLTIALPEVRLLVDTGIPADKLSAAQLLAIVAFRGQYRYHIKGVPPREPAVDHSLRVGLALERHGDDLTTVLGGFCHDMIEDTVVTHLLLADLFGSDVAELVRACTLNDEIYKPDNQRGNEDLIARVQAHGKRAVAVKLADITDNLATIKNVPRDWREEMLWCADHWLRLGQNTFGPQAPRVQMLATSLAAARK